MCKGRQKSDYNSVALCGDLYGTGLEIIFLFVMTGSGNCLFCSGYTVLPHLSFQAAGVIFFL